MMAGGSVPPAESKSILKKAAKQSQIANVHKKIWVISPLAGFRFQLRHYDAEACFEAF
ncbi:Uncharacterized protein dnm_000940 [Desulfonema magnum]|uniref:Uncharacterized protein n=1 Tax=Desulfonema magnum TaxID=45655 RepID=A0A975GJX5_9BACT|nr:Uncharacterized protein dnm_000940 [Desulfonema magnum]